MSEHGPAVAAGSVPSAQILDRYRSGGVTVSWLNHYSALVCDWNALSRIDMIGVDGTLLQLILRLRGVEVLRSSADITLPSVFDALGANRTCALIGGAPGVAAKAAQRLPLTSVFICDGYTGVTQVREEPSALLDADPDVVLLGLGAPLQDIVAAELAQLMPNAMIATVGGWLDQLAAAEQYFPPIVHRLRLGWLWRVVHEPQRLLKRYTSFAARAVLERNRLTRQIRALAHNVKGAFVFTQDTAGSPP